MAKKPKPRIAAVIDIGSNDLRLLIAQTTNVSGDGDAAEKIKSTQYLENISTPLGLGRDTFQTGEKSFDKADRACEIIKDFLHVIKGYGVRNIAAVATTAVREAANMDYILDQIKIKTGLSVNVLDDMEEKNYIYKLLMHYIGNQMNEPAMMVYIGTGNIGVSVIEDGCVSFLQNIQVGSLRIGELFENLEEYTSGFYRLMEEYLTSFTEIFSHEIKDEIKHFIASGQEIGLIAELTGVDTGELFFNISRSDFYSLYNDIKLKNADQIMEDYGIESEKAEALLPVACIFQNILGYTAAKRITSARLLPSDVILYEMLYPATFAQINKAHAENTILAARAIAERYNSSEKHYKHTYKFSNIIFDKMKKLHGLGSRDKLLLQTAAVLHDIGKYINNRDHHHYSYVIIRGTDIIGLSEQENMIVAFICLYHGDVTPKKTDPQYAGLRPGSRVLVSKLAAILRLADALDRSQMGKYSNINVKITDDEFIVTVITEKNIALEGWAFSEQGKFFEEVFGIKAKLRVKHP